MYQTDRKQTARAAAEATPDIIGDPARYAEVSRRIQAIERMRSMSWRHGRACWDQRRNDPLSPYGIALLFHQDDPEKSTGALKRQKVTAATKLWLAGPESNDLVRILFDLTRYVGETYVRSPGWDIRSLANRRDDDMQPQATYFGLGISSLDTSRGSWTEAMSSARSESDIPGVIRVVLADDTTIVCHRWASADFNAFQIHSSKSLEFRSGHSVAQWQFVEPEALRADAQHQTVFQWADQLHNALAAADNARIVHGQNPRRRSGR